MGYVPENLFWNIVYATDVCINLRYPAAGETSGIAIRLMGAGKPVILTAGQETSNIPEGACLRVDPGPPETEMLSQFMHWLALEPHSAQEIGRRASAYVREWHAPDKVAGMYLEVLNAASG